MNKKSVSRMYRRVLALMLAFVMVVGMVPVTAFAETETETTTESELVAFDAEVLAENAMANSEQLPVAWTNDGGAAWAFDEEAHWWHSRYQNWDEKGDHEVGSVAGDGKPSEENPIWIQTGFDKEWSVAAITYLPRQEAKGIVKDYTVSVANLEDPTATPADEDFTVVKTGTLECTTAEQTITLDEAVVATHVRLTVTAVYSGYTDDGADLGDGHVAAQNIKIYGTDVVVEEPGVDITSNMIAYYDFEDVADTTVPNKVGDAYPGTLVGGIATEADTEWGTSLKFVGDVNQYMQIDSIVNVAEKSYSVSLWYKADASVDRTGKNMVLVQQTGGGRTVLTLTGNNTYHTYVATQDVFSDNTVNVGEWQHVTLAYNTETNEVSFYVNGVLDSTKDAGSGDVNELTNLIIGRHKNAVTDPLPMNGLVDEIRVYEGVITEEQAAAIYAYSKDAEPEVPGEDDKLEVSERVQAIMDGMTLEEKIAQMMMVDFRKWGETDKTATDFTVMNETVSNIISEYDFGSIILFANNIKETEQSYNLTKAMQEAATKDGGLALLISADQEGGSVYRLGSGTALPGNMALGATGDTTNSYEAGKIIGSELQAVGINTNLAPVVDVNNNANNPVIGLRSYGDDATAVGEMAAASIQGMAQYNVIGCAKHFPGHGDTATDSHYGLPMVDKSLDVLLENELKPYEVAIEEGIEMIMTAHILYPQLESDTIVSDKTGNAESLPATMSDDILTGLLKGDMGFDGIIVTDAMNMAGISNNWDQVQSVKIAIAAGVDMICMPCTLYSTEGLTNLDAILNGVKEAVESGEIPESRINDAVARILTVKENRGILDYNAEDYSLETALATVGSAENRQTEREIAAAAVTVVKNENDVLPLDITADTNVLMLVPYANEISQMLMAWNRAVDAGLIPYGAEVDYYRFSSATMTDELMEKLAWADVVIINSEVSSTSRMAYKHWLSALPNAVCDYCAENGKISVISSVDKPYDVQLYPNADAVVAAYGCKGSSVDVTEALIGGATGSTAAYGPNIIAAVEVALGTFGAQGTLPVNVPVYDVDANTYTEEIAYARGYGLTYEAKAPIAVDTTELQAKVDTYKAVMELDGYYVDSLRALKAAVKEAEALMAEEGVTQYEIEAMEVALDEAFAEAEAVPSGAVEIDPAILAANAKANSEQLPIAWDNDGGAAWAFDEEAHWWHSRYQNWDQKGEHEVGSQSGDGKPSAENPIWIQTGFGEEVNVSYLTYLARNNGMGIMKDYTVSVANLEDPAAEPTDEDFTVVKTGVLEGTTDLQTITLDEAVAATHIRLTATSAYSGNETGYDYGDGHVAIQNLKIYAEEEALSRVDYLLSKMSLREKVTQMMMVDFRKWGATDDAATDFTVMNETVSNIISEYDFGSIILFANNIKETEQSYNLTMAMQDAATKDGDLALLISADQEGGSVYRLGSGTALPGNMALGATFDTTNALKAGQIIGSELQAVGINTNLAPVVDVNNNANNPVIGLRSYGDDATAVGEMAAASIQGMAEYNVIGCAKHFPGHGDTATDSHYGLPSVDKSLDVLLENELKPYEVAINEGIEMIMTAHILYPQLESDTIISEKTGNAESLPATMSDDILTGLLKGDMGFDGIIVTDAMNMAGISNNWDQVQSVKIAIAAGVDMICMPCTLYSTAGLENLDAIIDGVVAAVESGEIPESRLDDAVTRILTVKENRGILDYEAEDHTLEAAIETVGSDENRQTEREIAAAAVTVVKNEDNVLPLNLTAESKVLMLCPYDNERAQLVMGWNRAVEAGIIPEGAAMDYFRFSSASYAAETGLAEDLKAKIDWADTVIVVTEVSSTARMAYKHWLSNVPNEIVNYADETGKVSVIMSADKPYDVQLYPNADAVMAVYGCKGSAVDPTEAIIGGATGSTAAYGPNIIAGVEVALGTFGAQGKLPVNIPVYDVEANAYTEEIAYERGYGLTYDAKEPIVVEPQYIEDIVDVTAGDEELLNSDPTVEGPCELAIDGDESTIWHTDWYVGPNYDDHWIQLEFGSAYMVSGFEYLPRQTGNTNGIITSYKILVSEDGENWTEVAEGNWDSSDRSWKSVEFDAVKAKYIRLKSEGGESDIGIALTCAAEIRALGTVVACAEHTTELRGAVEATCAAEGYTGDMVCTNCLAVVEEGVAIERLPHTEVIDEAVEATCTEDGLTEGKHCSVCEEVIVAQETVKATGHNFGEWTETKAPTCTEAGSKEAVCATCGDTVTEEIAALGHAWGEWTVVKEATTEEEGLEERVCATCGEKEDRKIEKLPVVNPFIDVFENDWYYNAVIWGSQNRVVAGITENTFVPTDNCTRAQIVAFLWRAAGRPEPTNTDCPFTDVNSADYYYKAMLWAVEKEIAKGYADDKFAPDETCTRAEMAAFLWRIAGRNEVEGENPFTDISASDWYYDEAIWASQNNVVSGYTDGTFAPNNTIARAEAVTMLYRYYK